MKLALLLLLAVCDRLACAISPIPVRWRTATRVFRAHPRAGSVSTRWWLQPLDHFSHPRDTDAARWKQRVVINDEFWNRDGGPIFLYCGGEADIMLYVNSSGLLWENAERFKAMLVFVEVSGSLADAGLLPLPHLLG
jgi:hypothetical protein